MGSCHAINDAECPLRRRGSLSGSCLGEDVESETPLSVKVGGFYVFSVSSYALSLVGWFFS